MKTTNKTQANTEQLIDLIASNHGVPPVAPKKAAEKGVDRKKRREDEEEILADDASSLEADQGALAESGEAASATPMLLAQANTGNASESGAMSGGTSAAPDASVAASESTGLGWGGLLLGGLAVGGLAAAGVAASNNNDDNDSNDDSNDSGSGGGDAPPAVHNLVTGSLQAGPAKPGNGLTAVAYDMNGNELGRQKIGDDGTYSVDVGSYAGAIVLKVIDSDAGADFYDEGTGAAKDINVVFMAVAVVAAGTTNININAATTAAAVLAGFDANDGSGNVAGATAAEKEAAIKAANAAIAKLIGVTGDLLAVNPVSTILVDANGNVSPNLANTGSSDADKIGLFNAAMSGVDEANAGDMAKSLEDFAAAISGSGADVALSPAAIDALIAGALSAGVSATSIVSVIAPNAAAEASALGVTLDAAEAAALSSAVAANLTADQIASIPDVTVIPLTALAAISPEALAAGLDAAAVANLTGAQLAVLGGAQLAALAAAGKISGIDLSNVSPDALSALSSSQIDALSSAQVGQITSAQIDALNPTQIAGLGADIANLNNAALGSLDTAQLGALTGAQALALNPSQITALGAGIASLSTSALTNLDVAQLGALSDAQMQALSPAQIGSLSATQVAGFTATNADALSSAQLAAMAASDTIDNLSTAAVAAIPAATVGALTPASLAKLDVAQIGALTGAQLAQINATQIDALSPTQIDALGTAIASLSNAALGSLDATQAAALTGAQVQALSPSQIAAIGAGIAGLSNAALATLDAAQLGALSDAQMQALSPAQIGSLSATQVAGFTATNADALSGAQLAAMATADTIDNLSTAAVAVIPAAILGALAPASLAKLTVAQLGALTSTQVVQITALQIDALIPTQVAGLGADIASLSNTVLASLDAAQIGALTGPQAQAFSSQQIDLFATLSTPGGLAALINDATPTITGTFTGSLPGTALIAIYDGATKLGNAVVSGNTYTYQQVANLAEGAHSFSAVIDIPGGLKGTVSAALPVTIDVTAPAADLASAAGLTDFSIYMNETEALAGVSIASQVQAPTGSDLAKITIALAGPGLDTANDTLVLDSAKALNANFAASDVTLSSITGLSYDYQVATRTLVITKSAGGTLSGADIATVLGGIKLQTASTTSGERRFTVSYQDTLSNSGTTADSSLVLNRTVASTTTGAILTVTDDADSGTTIGTVATDNTTNDTTLKLDGTVSAALVAGEELAVYDGATYLGKATVDNMAMTWTYTTSALTVADHSFTVVVERPANPAPTRYGTASGAIQIHIAALSATATDNEGAFTGTIANGSTTDDTTPTLNGVLSAVLGSNEELAVYLSTDGGTTYTKDTTAVTRSGFSWNWTPGSELTDAGYTVKVIVQNTGNSDIANAKVITAAKTFNISGVPAATTTLLVEDNAAGGTAMGDIAADKTTNDTTPTLRGDITGTLGVGQVVGIYDTVNGVETRLGSATLSGSSWTYTTSALSSGGHNFKAVVENGAGGAQGTATTQAIKIAPSLSLNTISDDFGIAQGLLSSFASKENTIPVLSAASGTALTGGTVTITSSTQFSASYQPWYVADSLTTSEFATAGQQSGWWVQAQYSQAITPASIKLAERAAGSEYASSWRIQGSNDGANWDTLYTSASRVGTTPQTYSLATGNAYTYIRFYADTGVGANPGLSAFQIESANLITDDTTPTINGSLTSALGSGEELAVYLSTDGGASYTKSATPVTATGLFWNWTSGAALPDASYSVKVIVQDAGNSDIANAKVVTASSRFSVQGPPIATTTLLVTDDSAGGTLTGAVTAVMTTDDTTPVLSGEITGTLGAAHIVGIYDTVNGVETRLGTASLTGSSWTYTTSALGSGVHNFKAVVEAGAGGAQSAPTSQAVTIVSSVPVGAMVDDVGTIQGGVGVRYIMLVKQSTAAWDPAELSVYSNGVNIALNKTVTLGSQGTHATDGAKAAGLVDGNNATYYVGNYATTLPAYQWVEVDLGGYYSVDSISLMARSGFQSRQSGVTVFESGNSIMSALGLSAAGVMTAAIYTQLTTAANDAQLLSLAGTDSAATMLATWSNAWHKTTDDATPTMTGTLPTALGSGEELAIYVSTDGGTTYTKSATAVSQSGLDWSWTPGAALADGNYSIKAVLQNADNTDIANAKSVSVASAFTVNTVVPAPSAITTLVVTDDLLSGTQDGAIAAGKSTNDSTPTLSGVITGTLGAGEVVGIYDTLNGVETRLGTAALTGSNWTYATSALSSGVHTFKAVVEGGGLQGTAATQVVTIATSLSIIAAMDNVGSVQGDLLALQLTSDDPTPTLNGVLATVLGTGEEIAVYLSTDGGTTYSKSATAVSTSDLNWNWTPGSNLVDGAYKVKVIIQDTDNTAIGNAKLVSAVGGFTIAASTPSASTTLVVNDNAATNGSAVGVIAAGKSTDDTTPLLSGVITGTLAAGQLVGIYDTFNFVETRLGSATVSGANWTYTTSALANGAHSFKAVVEAGVGGLQGAAATQAVNIVSSLPLAALSDDFGIVQGAIATGVRYILLKQTGATTNMLQVNEVEVMVDGVNVAVGKAVTAGSYTLYAGYSAGGITDGSLVRANGYASNQNSTNNWLQIDLGAYYAIDSVNVKALSSTPGTDINNVINLGVFAASQSISGNTYAQLIAGTDGAVNLGTTTATYTNTFIAPSSLIGVTDDTRPTVNGVLSAALIAGDELAVYVSADGGASYTKSTAAVTLSGLNWSWTQDVALADGSYKIKVVIQDAGIVNVANAKVVSAATAFTVDTITPTALTTLTVTDDAANGTATGTIGADNSTNDSTPVLSGVITGALTASHVVAIYDTVNGVETRLGTATVSGSTWTFTTSSLAVGAHNFKAVVEAPVQGLQSTAATQVVNIVSTLPVSGVTDNVGSVQGLVGVRYIMVVKAANGAWDPMEFSVYSDGVNVALNKAITLGSQGYYGSSVAGSLIDGNTGTGYHNNWTAVIPNYQWIEIDLGAYYSIDSMSLAANLAQSPARQANVKVFESASSIMTALGMSAGTMMTETIFNQLPVQVGAGSAQGINFYGFHTGLAPHTQTWTGRWNETTDDNTPSYAGTLLTALGSGEELAVYVSEDGGVSYLKSATAVILSGLNWNWTPGAALVDGSYTLKVVIQDAGNTAIANAKLVSEASRVNVDTQTTISQTATILSVTDDAAINGSATGTLAAGTTMDDTTPTLTGTISSTLHVGHQVVVYDGLTRLGVATVAADNTWTFTSAALANGVHSFTARVENPSNGVVSTASAAVSQSIQKMTLTGIADNTGSITGDLFTVGTTGAARYVRFDTGNSESLQLNELEVWAYVNGTLTNVALNKAVTGRYATGQTFSVINDGSLATKYLGEDFAPDLRMNDYGKATDTWLQIDLGQAYVIDSISVIQISNYVRTGPISVSMTDMSGVETTAELAANPAVKQQNLVSQPITVNAADWTSALALATDDTTPTLSGVLALAKGASDAVQVMVNGIYAGDAVVSGTTWSFTPGTAFLAGANQVQVRLVDAGGRVIAATETTTLNINAAAPTATVNITSFTDDVGSVTGNMAAGSTDDTIPVLNGTISKALLAGEVVGVYDGLTKLGDATVSGTSWTYKATTALGVGNHSFTAVVENPATGVKGTASSAFVLVEQGLSVASIVDNVGSTVNLLAQGGLEAAPDAARFVRIDKAGQLDVAEIQVWVRDASGTLVNVALNKSVLANLPGNTGHEAGKLVDGSTATTYSQALLPLATYTGAGYSANWLQIDLGTNYNIEKIVVVPVGGFANRIMGAVVAASELDMSGLTAAQVNAAAAIAKQTISSTVTPSSSGVELTGWATRYVTDDATLALSGSLKTALASGEVVAVYDGITKLGTATLTGNDWSFATSALTTGTHAIKVQIETATGTARLAVTENITVDVRAPASYSFRFVSASGTDDVGVSKGALANGAYTDDTLPGVTFNLNAPLDGIHQVAVYEGATLLGLATGSGTAYTFNAPTLFAPGAHTLTAKIINPATGAVVDTATPFTLNIQTIAFNGIIDDTVALTGNAWAHTYNFGLDPVTHAQGYNVQGGTSYTDDTMPLLKGALGMALVAGQELAIYDGATKLGVATVTNGTDWQYQITSALAEGTHSISAQVLNSSTGALVQASEAITLSVMANDVANPAAYGAIGYGASAYAFTFQEMGQTLDLTMVAGASQLRIDTVNLAGDLLPVDGGNTLILGLEDVLLAGTDQFNVISGFAGLSSNGRHQMLISGVEGSTVKVTDLSGWTAAGTVFNENNGQTYLVYNHDTTAQLLIDAEITRQGAVL